MKKLLFGIFLVSFVSVFSFCSNLDKQLLEAAQKGNLEEVKKLIAAGADVNAPHLYADYPTSPLYLAIDSGNIELIKFLIEKGADVNFEDYDCGEADCGGEPSSPLIKAVELGNKEIVSLLLNKGADVDMEVHSGDDIGNTALRAAVKGNKKEMISLLLKRGSKDISVALARPDLLPALLKNGANINEDLFYSCGNIVSIAKEQKKSKLVSFFIKQGAKDSEETDCGFRLDYAWGSIDTQLIAACETGDLQLARTLVEYGANVNTVIDKRYLFHPVETDTPLIGAVQSGNYELVKFLLDSGANANEVVDKGKTALSFATNPKIKQLLKEKGGYVTLFEGQGGYVSLPEMKKRIEQGADVNAKATFDGLVGDDYTVLIYAVRKNDLETVKLLITSGADVNAAYKHYHGEVPAIFETVNWGKDYADMAELLIKNGADTLTTGHCEWSQKDKHYYNDSTPFAACAVLNNAKGVVKKLINAGTISSNYNKLPDLIKIAKEYGYTKIENLLNSAAKQESLISASKKGNIKLVKSLVNNKSQINMKDNLGETPLIKASENGHTEIVKILLKNGANVNAKNDWETTALMLAAKEGHTEIVKLLIAAGADINNKNTDGHTALMWAKKNGHNEVVKLLNPGASDGKPVYTASADDNQKIKNPSLDKKRLQKKLIHACRWGSAAEVEQALKEGADVNAADEAEDFPLQQAILSNKPEKVALLLKYGANVNPGNESVLQLTKKHKNNEIIEMLKKAGAKEKKRLL